MSEFERILQYYSYPIDEPFEGQDGESLLSDEGFGHSSSIGISFFVAISVLLTLTIINGLREHIFRTRQIDLCPIFGRFSNQQQQIQRDRDMAEAMQLQMNQESNVNNLEAKEARREYRRAWYVMFMRDYTMTTEKQDFFHAQDPNDIEAAISTDSDISECSRDIGNNEKNGVVEKKGEQNFEQYDSIKCADEDERNRLRLILPVKDQYGNCRSIDAHCAICFSDYECGDKIVWSGLQCQHAFHYDCMLPWLVKGKKRCPICRDMFVPESNIHDQKKQYEERLDRESNGSDLETEPMQIGSTQDTPNSSEGTLDGERLPTLQELIGLSHRCSPILSSSGCVTTSTPSMTIPATSTATTTVLPNQTITSTKTAVPIVASATSSSPKTISQCLSASTITCPSTAHKLDDDCYK